MNPESEKWLNQQVDRILVKEYADLENARRRIKGRFHTMAKRGRKPGQKVTRTAVSYSVAAALKVLESGSLAQKADIAKRYPLFTIATDRERLSSLNGMTARKLEAMLRGGDSEEEAAAPAAKVKKGGTAVADKPKRGPGRPPKAKPVDEDEDEDSEDDEEEEEAPKRKRGRPAKAKVVTKTKKSKKDEDEDDLESLMDSDDEDEEEDDEGEDDEDSEDEEDDESEEDEDEEEPAPVKKSKKSKK